MKYLSYMQHQAPCYQHLSNQTVYGYGGFTSIHGSYCTFFLGCGTARNLPMLVQLVQEPASGRYLLTHSTHNMCHRTLKATSHPTEQLPLESQSCNSNPKLHTICPSTSIVTAMTSLNSLTPTHHPQHPINQLPHRE